MRKYGKYEKMPDGTRAKQPPVKSMLLQTYLTSLLCMVLCVAMFFGTTYAWFTSEVKNEGNEIYIGMLDVDLLKQVKNTEGVFEFKSLADTDEKAAEYRFFDKDIRWEPGYTAMETIQIKNEGDLAFRYELTFTDGKVTGQVEKTLAEIAEWFTVWCYRDNQNAIPTPENYEQITVENGWTKVGTLDEILNGKPVLQGEMTEEEVTADPQTAHTYTIALHMDGEKDLTAEQQGDLNDMMGQRLSLNVKLVATQLSSEEDAFGNLYDSDKKITAKVTELGDMEIQAYGIGPMQLDAAYQFQPLDSEEDVKTSPYKDYVADFVVYADEVVGANSIALAGYYNEFCQYIDGQWIALQYDGVVQPGEELRLVAGLYYPLTYELLCQFGNDGTGFLCGIANLDEANVGKTITVELRLFERDEQGNETGEYVVANTVKYTIQPEADTQ